MNDTRPQSTAAARLHGLTKRFAGFELGPLDLTLEPGTVLALVGPNGAGKTTTLNCIAGLVVPDEGGIEVFGAPVHPARPAFRRDVGYVGEQSGFFRRWSAKRNLDFMAELLPGWSRDRASRLAERFALPMDKPVNTLSRGNHTKLALVAALAHGPRLLLLDEPTAGLDGIGVLAAGLAIGVGAVYTGKLELESLHIVGYVGGLLLMMQMMGLVAQEAMAARRQRRPRAAAAGWTGFVAAALLLATLSVAALFLSAPQGFLTWTHLHLANLIVAMTAMAASVALYAGRTDFTR